MYYLKEKAELEKGTVSKTKKMTWQKLKKTAHFEDWSQTEVDFAKANFNEVFNMFYERKIVDKIFKNQVSVLT